MIMSYNVKYKLHTKPIQDNIVLEEQRIGRAMHQPAKEALRIEYKANNDPLCMTEVLKEIIQEENK